MFISTAYNKYQTVDVFYTFIKSDENNDVLFSPTDFSVKKVEL